MAKTLEQAKAEAHQLAAYAATTQQPCAFEVVKLARKTVDGEIYRVQPFGLHAIIRSNKLLHIAPIPDEVAA
jgi:hypothetical protein